MVVLFPAPFGRGSHDFSLPYGKGEIFDGYELTVIFAETFRLNHDF